MVDGGVVDRDGASGFEMGLVGSCVFGALMIVVMLTWSLLFVLILFFSYGLAASKCL